MEKGILEKSNICASDGNTKASRSRMIPSKYWCFTWNNYNNDDIIDFEHICDQYHIKYIFGKEVGANGTPHLQGYIESPTKIRPIEKLKLSKRIHWEMRKGSKQQNITYCSKEGDFKTSFDEKSEDFIDVEREKHLDKMILDLYGKWNFTLVDKDNGDNFKAFCANEIPPLVKEMNGYNEEVDES